MDDFTEKLLEEIDRLKEIIAGYEDTIRKMRSGLNPSTDKETKQKEVFKYVKERLKKKRRD